MRDIGNSAALADRWHDRRAVMNLAGKYVMSLLLKREGSLFDDFWSAREDVCLRFNDGSYVGAAAVRGYYAAQCENTALVSRFLKERFPAQLGSMSEEELFGVGQFHGLPITTPVVEVAGNGETARGLWHVHGTDNTLGPWGPLSWWKLGFLAIDFRREGGRWRLWHVFHAEDVTAPMGENWLRPAERKELPEYAALKALKKPAYTVTRDNYRPYSPTRPLAPPPEIPEPYESFEQIVGYGEEASAR